MYDFLNYQLLDPPTMDPLWFRYGYVAFNLIEALVWLIVGLVIFIKHQKNLAGYLQLLAFCLFGASDVMECFGTSPLLLLFKGALILALLQGRAGLKRACKLTEGGRL